MRTPIITAALHPGDQEESSSNFQNSMLFQLSLIVHITQSMERRSTKVEKDMATMKRCMALGYDDDMVFDDTLLRSPGDQPPPPQPPSTNIPPSSYPPLSTPPPPPRNSPPQSDVAKKGENNQGDA